VRRWGFMKTLITGLMVSAVRAQEDAVVEVPQDSPLREDLLNGNGIFRTGSRFKYSECEDGPEPNKWCKSDR